MTIHWLHVEVTGNMTSGIWWQGTGNDAGTRVKNFGGFAHPSGTSYEPSNSEPTAWPSNDETSNFGSGWFPIAGTLRTEEELTEGLTIRGVIGFAIPPGQRARLNMWWDLED